MKMRLILLLLLVIFTTDVYSKLIQIYPDQFLFAKQLTNSIEDLSNNNKSPPLVSNFVFLLKSIM